MRLALAIVAAIGLADVSAAAIVEVFPGAGTPLQDGIDAALPGDTVLVHGGSYLESITIAKSLRLARAADGAVTVDAGCGAASAVSIEADGVVLDGTDLIFRGGTVADIDIQNRDRVTIRGEISAYGFCPGVQYGVNVVNSTRVRLNAVTAIGYGNAYAHAAIHVAAIPVGGRVKVTDSGGAGALRGILVESCPFGSRVVLRSNRVVGYSFPVTDGIVLEGADGVRVLLNTVSAVGGRGRSLDAASDDNRLTANVIINAANGDAADAGTSNCWLRNQCATICPDASGCP